MTMQIIVIITTAHYLLDGPHDLAGLLIKGVGAPVGVEAMQLLNQSVVLPQKHSVQCDHTQVLIGSGVP